MKVLCSLILLCVLWVSSGTSIQARELHPWWQIQSIDTMKSSRDLSGQVLDHPEGFTELISIQVQNIADTGATHVAIGTPYDAKFLPVLRLWVAAARANGLNVWFRGNFAGWEEWFDAPAISRAEHKELTREFIRRNSDLFADGDIFSPCPECENGGPGDPRMVGGVAEHRQFLIDLYSISRDSFHSVGKNVMTNIHSMNGDVARLIMDPETTKALGGVVTIDHYVGTPEQLVEDIREFATTSGGKVVLGEYGVPIPDIHGNMTQAEQAEWIERSLSELTLVPELIGINYWVNVGGSTALWGEGGAPRKAVESLRQFYSPPKVSGRVVSRVGRGLANVTIKTPYQITHSRADGSFLLPLSREDEEISVFAAGYVAQNIAVSPFGVDGIEVRLEKNSYSFWERVFWYLRNLF